MPPKNAYSTHRPSFSSLLIFAIFAFILAPTSSTRLSAQVKSAQVQSTQIRIPKSRRVEAEAQKPFPATASSVPVTTTISTVPFPLIGLMYSDDGQSYAVNQGTLSCREGYSTACGSVWYALNSPIPSIYFFDSPAVFPTELGNSQWGLIEGPDGYLYGTTSFGANTQSGECDLGMIGCGAFYKVGKFGSPEANDFQLLYTFTASGGQGGPIILGGDGNFYGVTSALGEINAGSIPYGIFKLTPDGDYTLLVDFTQYINEDTALSGFTPQGLMEASDGNFYTTSLGGTSLCVPTQAGCNEGVIAKMTPEGDFSVLTTFPQDGSLGAGPVGPLVEGPDGGLFGIGDGTLTNAAVTANPSIFKVTTAGEITPIYTFPFGSSPPSALLLGGDGKLYGATGVGGGVGCPSFDGCGTLFSLNTDGSDFQTLYDFPGGQGGAEPYSLAWAPDGSLTGMTGSDAQAGSPVTTVFKTTFPAGQQTPPIQMQFYYKDNMQPIASGTTVSLGDTLILKWNLLNGYSSTLTQCYAYTYTGDGGGNWSGQQKGIRTSAGFGGQAEIIPTAAPTKSDSYTYTLACGGIESQSVTLRIGETLQIETPSLPKGTVPQTYQAILMARGGTYPYVWSVEGPLPKGLAFDSSKGTLSGTPLQYGDYSLTFEVTDSSTVPLTASATFPLTVVSGLVLGASLPNAIVGKSYSQAIQASGGLTPYTWKLVSGTLPAGLKFNSSAGVIYGTPTTSGKSSFVVSITDVENPSAMVSQSYTLSTAVPPLDITTPINLPDASVGLPYSVSFTATGGTPPYVWTFGANDTPNTGIPAGLSLSSDGVLSGIPKQYTSYDYIDVIVTDNEVPAVQAQISFRIVIKPTLTITTASLPNATVGVPYSVTLTATGGIAPYKWIASSNPPPSSLGEIYLDGAVLNGVFTQATTATFTLQVQDSEPDTGDIVSIALPLTILPAPLPTTTTIKTSSPNVGTGEGVNLTANVTRSGGGAPPGMVIFYSGATSLGTATLDADGNATLQTSFRTAGVYSLTAAFGGSTGYAASVSAPLSETVIIPTVSAAIAPTSLTIKPGASGTLMITLTPAGNYTGTLNFSCGTLPAHVSCTFAPPSLTIAPGSGPVTDTLTVSTDASLATASSQPQAGQTSGSIWAAAVLWMPGSIVAFVGFVRRKKLNIAARGTRMLCILCLGLAGAGMLSACGGNSNNARAGTYSIPVTLTLSGGATQNVNATVIIQ